MCGFCESTPYNSGIDVIWRTRSTMADDNLTETLEEFFDYKSIESHSSYFTIGSSDIAGNTLFYIDYREENTYGGETVTVSPFSELMHFNYCPFCGKQISKEIKSFEELLAREYGMYLEPKNNKTNKLKGEK